MKKFLSLMAVLLCAVMGAWANLPLNALPEGTTSFANYNWGGTLDKNKYNPQNEMFRKNKTKRSRPQNEMFFFRVPSPQ